MRILFVHDHPFYKEGNDVYSGGGLPNYVWNNYLKYFDEVVVFGRLSTDEKDRKILSSGSDGVRFELTSHYKSIKNFAINFFKLKSDINNEVKKSDIVLVRLPSVLGIITAFIASKQKKKIIVEQVGNGREALVEHGSFVGKLVGVLFNYLNKSIVRKANYVSYVTIKKLQEDYPTRALTVSLSNVVINEIVEQSGGDEKFFSTIFKIGLIGGFDVRYKGQDVLLKAISILPTELKKDVQIYFVGKGDFSWLIKIAEEIDLLENISFIGAKSAGDEVLKFLELLSLYVQPSFTEGMPRALLEAMSVGCPCVGSNAGGIPDVISEEYIHKRGDFKTLSKHIYDFMIDRQKLKKESKRSITVVSPYLKIKLNEKRDLFYSRIIEDLKNE